MGYQLPGSCFEFTGSRVEICLFGIWCGNWSELAQDKVHWLAFVR
jgi:hypothetical protein